MPESENLSEEDRNKVMHIALPIGNCNYLMATDSLESFGPKTTFGNNCQIMISPDSKEEADRLFDELSEGGKADMPMQDQFWGAYFGSFTDKFGVNWMIHYDKSNK